MALLDEELRSVAYELGECFAAGEGEFSPEAQLGWGLRIDGIDDLTRLPRPYSSQQRGISLNPLLVKWGEYLATHCDEVLRGAKPEYIRVLAIGHEAARPLIWHCDQDVQKIKGNLVSRVNPRFGRLVINLAGRPESEGESSNIKMADGKFVVHDTVLEPDAARAVEEMLVCDRGQTLVSAEAGSVIAISDPEFEPPVEGVVTASSFSLVDTTGVTLHRATEVPDFLRFSLQCNYLLPVGVSRQ